MSKIFIISNTNFNISKQPPSKEWLKNMDNYFSKVFIPYLTDNVQPNDILIHLGNLTHKSKTIDLTVLKFVQDTFEKMSNILPIYILEGENDKLSLNILKNFNNVDIIRKPTELDILLGQRFVLFPSNTKVEEFDKYDSDYCFFNYDYLNSPKKDIIVDKLKFYQKCYNGFYNKNGVTKNIKNLGSPYNIDSDDKKGFIVLETHTNKDKFILNKFSPSFKKISINSESDLDISPDTLRNNYVSVNINKNILVDNKLKIEMLLSEYDIVNVSYSDDEIIKDREDVLELNENSLSLKEMVIDYINQSPSNNKERILQEFNKLVELNKK